MQVDCNAHNNKPRGFIPDSERILSCRRKSSQSCVLLACCELLWPRFPICQQARTRLASRGSHEVAPEKLPEKLLPLRKSETSRWQARSWFKPLAQEILPYLASGHSGLLLQRWPARSLHFLHLTFQALGWTQKSFTIEVSCVPKAVESDKSGPETTDQIACLKKHGHLCLAGLNKQLCAFLPDSRSKCKASAKGSKLKGHRHEFDLLACKVRDLTPVSRCVENEAPGIRCAQSD